MYNSPLEHCSVCNTYVALDQLQDECAREYGCGRTRDTCPLASHLVGSEPQCEAQIARDASESQTGLGMLCRFRGRTLKD